MGGGDQKIFQQRELRVLKMWVERTIDLDLTIYYKIMKTKISSDTGYIVMEIIWRLKLSIDESYLVIKVI